MSRKRTRKKMTGIYDALQEAVPQLQNIGSFNPKKLDPEWKDWLMRAERVYIDTFAGDFKLFFGAVATVYKNALDEETDPEQDIQDWIMAEIAVLEAKSLKARIQTQ
ncbi:hypothetical protein K2P47_04725 [Patescibacteria group bacterium]|nr:hypothetical protein [Patescibacteria group bacterium]